MGESWPQVPLGEVLRPVSRPVTLAADRTYSVLGARWYAGGLFVKDVKLGAAIQARTAFVVREGDFVYNRLFAWKGSFALATASDDGCIVSNEFPCFEIRHDRLDATYLRLYFMKAAAWNEALGLSSGSTPTSRNRLKEDRLLSMKIPLPPLEEQRRIVARVEAIAAKVEEAQRLREAAVAETEALSDSIEGSVFAFPGTPVSRVDTFAEVRGGIQKTPDRTAASKPVRYLTVAHVQRDRVMTSDPRYFEVTGDELERWRLKSGDVLVIEGNGSADQIGRTALFRGEIEDCVHQNHVIRIRPNPKVADPEFVNAFLNSSVGRAVIQAESRTTSGLRTLSVGRIRALQIPIPPVALQHSAVTQIKVFREHIVGLRRMHEDAAARADAFVPAVLDRAFRGEL